MNSHPQQKPGDWVILPKSAQCLSHGHIQPMQPEKPSLFQRLIRKPNS